MLKCKVDPKLMRLLAPALIVGACGGRAVHNTTRDAGHLNDATAEASDSSLPDSPVVDLALGWPGLVLFADGSVWGWTEDWPGGKLSLTPAIHYSVLDGAASLTRTCELFAGGTASCHAHQDGAPTASMPVPDLHAGRALASDAAPDTALLADGTVAWWPIDLAPYPVIVESIGAPSQVPGLVNGVDIVGVALTPGLVTCVTDTSDAVTCVVVSPHADAGATYSPIDAALSPAHLSSGPSGLCFIPASGSPHCWVDVVYPSAVNHSETRPFNATIEFPPDAGRVRTVSVAGGFNACALTDDGKVYVTSGDGPKDAGSGTAPDASVDALSDAPNVTLAMQRLDGVGPANRVVAGNDTCCAVTPPNITCWATEGFNAWQPMFLR